MRVTKEVKNKGSVSRNQFEILKYLTQYLTITKISKLRKTSRTAVYNTLNKLLKKGMVRKIGKVYELTDEGKGGLHSFSSLSTQLRLHKLTVKIRILKRPLNWELKRNKICSIRVNSKQVSLKNTVYQIHNLSNVKVKTTSKSIIMFLPSFYGKNTDVCFQQALEVLWKVMPKIEALFNILLIKDKYPNIEIISNHYSKLRDSLAKIYRKERKRLYVKDKNGLVWLITDASYRIDELETIDTSQAKEDMDTVQTFFNDLRQHPTRLTQLTHNQKFLTKAIQGVTNNQVVFDRNMQSHIKAIQQLGSGVKQFNLKIDQFSNLIGNLVLTSYKSKDKKRLLKSMQENRSLRIWV